MELDNYKLVVTKYFSYYMPKANKKLYRMLFGEIPKPIIDNRLYVQIESLAGIIIDVIRINKKETINTIKLKLIKNNAKFVYYKLALFDGNKHLDNNFKIQNDITLFLIHSDTVNDWRNITIKNTHHHDIYLTQRGYVTKNKSNKQEMIYYDKKGKEIGRLKFDYNFEIISGNIILIVQSQQSIGIGKLITSTVTKQIYNVSTKQILYTISGTQYNKWSISQNNKYMCITENVPYLKLIVINTQTGEKHIIENMRGKNKLGLKARVGRTEIYASAVSNNGQKVAVATTYNHRNNKVFIIENNVYEKITYFRTNTWNQTEVSDYIPASNIHFNSNSSKLIIRVGYTWYNSNYIYIYDPNISINKIIKVKTNSSYLLTTRGNYIACFDCLTIEGENSMGIILYDIENNITYLKPYPVKKQGFLHLTKGGRALIIGSPLKLEIHKISDWIKGCVIENNNILEGLAPLLLI